MPIQLDAAVVETAQRGSEQARVADVAQVIGWSIDLTKTEPTVHIRIGRGVGWPELIVFVDLRALAERAGELEAGDFGIMRSAITGQVHELSEAATTAIKNTIASQAAAIEQALNQNGAIPGTLL